MSLPPVDGWYWLHNLGDDGEPRWRIVDVGGVFLPNSRKMVRVAQWLSVKLLSEEIAEWDEVKFVGPLRNPDEKLKGTTKGEK